jgi:prepilin-type N-terminal cleavage/methylation domain-containing protein
MKRVTGLSRRRAGRGFTLIELLLVLVLVLMFMGALVFNFANLQQGTELEQGAEQVENLLRFARAHAANVGRPVQIRLEEDYVDEFVIASGTLVLNWEPDPLSQPGVMETVSEAGDYLQRISELVQVESMRVLDTFNLSQSANPAEGSPETVGSVDSSSTALLPITFYPDGSSDSAEITLAARSGDDPRRIVIQISDITGSIRRLSTTNGTEQTDLDTATNNPTQQETNGVESLKKPKPSTDPSDWEFPFE